MKKLNTKLTMKGQVRKAYKEMVHLLDPRTITADEHIPLSLIKHAKGLVFLTVVKAGFLIAGNVGTGIIIKKLPDNSWSNPASVGIGGFGVGIQVGVTSIETILVLTSEEAVDTFCNNGQFKLGGSLSVAAGPVGRQGEAAFAPAIKSKQFERPNRGGQSAPRVAEDPRKKFTLVSCYSYSHSSGLFAGVSVEGMVILQRPKDNKNYYGSNVSVRDILDGNVQKVEYDRNLHLLHQSLALLEERVGATSECATFDELFVPTQDRNSFEEDDPMSSLRKSTVFRERLSLILNDTESDTESIRPPRPGFSSFVKDKFVPINQPTQPPNFEKMQQHFTLRKTHTIIGEGRKKIRLMEYEWMVELKALVLDSGFLFTYGMLTYDKKKKDQDYFFDDFEYLMFALVEGGRLQKSLARMKKVMGYIFKKGYQFRYFDLMGKDADSAIEFEKIYHDISLNIGPDTDNAPTIGIDLSKLRPENWSDGREAELIQLLIWMLRVSCPTLEAFRGGINVVIDMSESTKENIPKTRLREKLRKFFAVVVRYFPIKIKRIILVKTHSVLGLKTAISSVGKVVLPSVVRSKIQVLTEDQLTKYYPEESIPLTWGGHYIQHSPEGFRRFLKRQGKQYIKTNTQVSKVQEEVEDAHLF